MPSAGTQLHRTNATLHTYRKGCNQRMTTKMNLVVTSILVLVGAPLVLCQSQLCQPGNPDNDHPLCQNAGGWHVGADRRRGGGVVVHGQAGGPLGEGVSGNVHGDRTFGGPANGAQSVGGGLNYNHPSGLHGGVDATHTRGQGNQFSGTVGGSTRLGPGTLSIDGGVTGGTGGKPQTNVGLTYSVSLD